MKKRLFIIGMISTLAMGTSVVAYADEAKYPEVKLSADKEFVFDDIELKEFEGMLPGETATQKIKLTNEYKDAINFFLSQETVEEINNANKASGGAFNYTIAVADNEEGKDAVSLLEKEIGGVAADGTNLEAFTGVDELKDYTYIANLANKESAYIILTLSIDGEGNDNDAEAADYTNFLSTLSFNFRAYDGVKIIVDDPEPTIIERVVEVVKNNPYKGGDATSVVAYTLTIVAGLALIFGVVLFARKKKGEETNE